MNKKRILYLQLPLLDNDTRTARENFMFAGTYLDHALRNSDEAAYFESVFSPPDWDDLDTRHLAEQILRTGADIICCTLYLWNIERTLHLATLLKKSNPLLRIAAGGPETAKDHPLLYAEDSPFDAVTVGEGETVFPRLLQFWRTGTPADFKTLGLHTGREWIWGKQEPEPVDLIRAQPPEEILMQCVQDRPTVYIETVRGCPLTCSYCRYYQLHSGLRKMSPEDVVARIERFRDLGATEIRFVDPTFNARPRFTDFLNRLAELNRDHRLSFFAEIRSDTLTKEQAERMKQANFTEVEVGIQSIDPDVLKNVTRPVRLDRAARGIQALCDAGVKVVLDIMYGLPGQTLTDVRQSLDWALAFGDGVQVQCMQTLILPGTVLRSEAEQWSFCFDDYPPYAIRETAHLAPDDIREIEIALDDHPDLPADPLTPRFCSRRLSGLFKEQIRIPVNDLKRPVPGKSNRRAVIIPGADLFSKEREIADFIQRAIAQEPDILWQFVLVPEAEEPLDLIENIAVLINKQERHMLDRFASAAAFEVTVSRRLFIRTNTAISNDWKEAAEELLRQTFG